MDSIKSVIQQSLRNVRHSVTVVGAGDPGVWLARVEVHRYLIQRLAHFWGDCRLRLRTRLFPVSLAVRNHVFSAQRRHDAVAGGHSCGVKLRQLQLTRRKLDRVYRLEWRGQVLIHFLVCATCVMGMKQLRMLAHCLIRDQCALIVVHW